MCLKVFLDTTNGDEIWEAVKMGLLDGALTNPLLIAKEGAKFEERIVA